MRKITTIILAIAMVLSMVVLALPAFAVENGETDSYSWFADLQAGINVDKAKEYISGGAFTYDEAKGAIIGKDGAVVLNGGGKGENNTKCTDIIRFAITDMREETADIKLWTNGSGHLEVGLKLTKSGDKITAKAFAGDVESASFPFEIGKVYELASRMNGTAFACFVNGELLASKNVTYAAGCFLFSKSANGLDIEIYQLGRVPSSHPIAKLYTPDNKSEGIRVDFANAYNTSMVSDTARGGFTVEAKALVGGNDAAVFQGVDGFPEAKTFTDRMAVYMKNPYDAAKDASIEFWFNVKSGFDGIARINASKGVAEIVVDGKVVASAPITVQAGDLQLGNNTIYASSFDFALKRTADGMATIYYNGKAVVSANVGAAAESKAMIIKKDNCDVEIYNIQRAAADYKVPEPTIAFDFNYEGAAVANDWGKVPGAHFWAKTERYTFTYDAENGGYKMVDTVPNGDTYGKLSSLFLPSEYHFVRIEFIPQFSNGAATINVWYPSAAGGGLTSTTSGSIYASTMGQNNVTILPMGRGYDLPGPIVNPDTCAPVPNFDINSWNGRISEIRLDIPDALGAQNDYAIIKSIMFFASKEEAEAYGQASDATVSVDKTSISVDGTSSAYINVTTANALTDSAWIGIVPANVANPTSADVVGGKWAYVKDAADNVTALDVGTLANGKYKIAMFDSTSALTATVLSDAIEVKAPVEAKAPLDYYNAHMEFNAVKEGNDDRYLNASMTTNLKWTVDEENSTILFTAYNPGEIFGTPLGGEANFVIKGRPFSTENLGAIVIRYKLNSECDMGEIFFRGKDEDGEDIPGLGFAQGGDPYQFRFNNSGEWETVVIDVSGWEKFQQCPYFDLLRVDTMNSEDGKTFKITDTFELDYIALFENVDVANAFIGSSFEENLPKIGDEPETSAPDDTTVPDDTSAPDDTSEPGDTDPDTTPVTPPDTENPATGEYAMIAFAVIAVIALGGFIVVKKIRA